MGCQLFLCHQPPLPPQGLAFLLSKLSFQKKGVIMTKKAAEPSAAFC